MGKATIYICTHKDFDKKVNNEAYKTLHIKGISTDLPLDDKFYSELYHFKYVSEHLPRTKYVGFCHYRRYFDFYDELPNFDEIFKEHNVIACKPFRFPYSVRGQYSAMHNGEDLDIITNIIKEKHPEFLNDWNNSLNGEYLYPFNMFIMKTQDFKQYIKFIIDVLNEYVKIVGTDINKHIEDNKDKYLKPFSPNNTIEYQYRIGGYLAERLTSMYLQRMGNIKTYNVEVTERKY